MARIERGELVENIADGFLVAASVAGVVVILRFRESSCPMKAVPFFGRFSEPLCELLGIHGCTARISR